MVSQFLIQETRRSLNKAIREHELQLIAIQDRLTDISDKIRVRQEIIIAMAKEESKHKNIELRAIETAKACRNVQIGKEAIQNNLRSELLWVNLRDYHVDRRAAMARADIEMMKSREKKLLDELEEVKGSLAAAEAMKKTYDSF